MKRRFDNFLRLRYAVVLLIGSAVVLAVVGELAYQRTISSLRYGIGLTEARIGSARILQLLSDAEPPGWASCSQAARRIWSRLRRPSGSCAATKGCLTSSP